MNNIVDVTGGHGGNAFLLLGKEKTALVDCGMAYCASNLIRNIKKIIDKKALDYILISHSHYDHIGAIPYLKTAWPKSRVFGAEHAKQVLTRANALTTIRSLNVQAAQLFAAGVLPEYDDAMLKVDDVIGDDDILDLGGLSINVIATTGHTKCSLSFLINKETLFASESTGYMSQAGIIHPSFLTSYSEALDSIKICQKIDSRFIISPHYGLVNPKDTLGYWRKCSLAVQATTKFIFDLSAQGYDKDQILTKYEAKFRDEQSRLEQPIHAFRLNALSMIKTVLRAKYNFLLRAE